MSLFTPVWFELLFFLYFSLGFCIPFVQQSIYFLAKSVSQLAWFKCSTAFVPSTEPICLPLFFSGFLFSLFFGFSRSLKKRSWVRLYGQSCGTHHHLSKNAATIRRADNKPKNNLQSFVTKDTQLVPPTKVVAVFVSLLFLPTPRNFCICFFFLAIRSPAFPWMLYCCCQRLSAVWHWCAGSTVVEMEKYTWLSTKSKKKPLV